MILPVLPIILPFSFAVLMLLFYNNKNAHRIMNLIGSAISLYVAYILIKRVNAEGIILLQVGSWQAPFGISIVADSFASIMVLITAIIGFATAIYSLGSMDEKREKFFYYPLMQILLMGINGAFLTGDIFNLYVWFEVMLISSFVLLALGGKKEQLEGAIKYVTINLLSSAIFLAAVGILYGLVGTLNMADIARKIVYVEHKELVNVVAFLFMVAFGIKAAVFPLFFWLPASYHTPPVAVSAIFAGLLTKVGVYALIRVFTLIIFVNDIIVTHTVLLVIAGFTMLTGVLGAATQMDFRKILSFHIISQIGYMIMGLALFTPLAIAGAVFYIFHHIIVKRNLLFIRGIIDKMKGGFALKKLGSVYKLHPFISLLFFIPAFSLAGIPPLSGFWAKFIVIKAGLDVNSYIIVALALFVGILTLFSMTKIWNEVFLKDAPGENDNLAEEFYSTGFMQRTALILPGILLALITLFIGLNPEPFFLLAKNAADQLLNPAIYINTVLGLQ